jgi:TPR repeat protein
MRNLIRAGTTVVVLSLGLAASAAAGPFEDGAAAYKSGDYATAIRLWQPLADQGNADAQTQLGFMYWKGQGVSPDNSVAVSWYRKAADEFQTS